MYVAIVYDSAALSVGFFVDGVMTSLSASSLPTTPSKSNAASVIGSSVSANTGFAGSIKGVFFYDEALNEHELRYLMTSSGMYPPLNAGRFYGIQALNSSQLVGEQSATNTTLQAPAQLFIDAVSPKFIVAGTQAIITVSGEGFRDDDIFCYYSFEIRPVLGRVISDTTLQCDFPGFNTPGGVQLALSPSAGLPLSNALEIVVVDAMTIDSISPSSGPPDGGNLLSIAGRMLPAYEQLYCLFDGSNILSARMDSGLVSCVAPPSKTRQTQVRLSTQGQELVSNAVVYTYEVGATLSFIIPELGQVEGGTAVTIRGNNFKEDDSVLCFFGSVQVSVVRVNSTAMSVITPPSPNGLGAVNMHCMQNDVPMASPGIEFTYIPGLRIAQVSPQLGYSSARNRVSVIGSEFLPDLSMNCQVGESLVAAQVSHQSPGVTSVQISINRQNFARDKLDFAIQGAAIVDFFTPSFGFIGVANAIRIAAKNIPRDVQLECYFTELDLVVSESSFNGSTRECITPTVSTEYGLSVSVQVREANRGRVLLEAPFRYHKPPEISDVLHSAVLESGKTLVYVRGHNFFETSETVCQFGSSSSRVPATRINATTIVCMAPSHRPESVQLRVCFSELQCTSSFAWFQYHLFPLAMSLAPSSGYQFESTSVQVSGEDFFNASSLACRFGASVVTAAKFQSDSLVECVAPALSRGCVRFDLVVDGQIHSTSRGPDFCYLPKLVVNSILPANGPAKGGTRVLVQGGTFVKPRRYSCNFGSQATLAKFVTDIQLVCVSPPGSLRTVLFSVSEPGMPPTSSDVIFRYAELPSISSLSPSRGSELGMYRLLITGSGFIRSPALMCRFGALDVVPALWISENVVSCVAPGHEPGFVGVFVTNNLVDYSEDASVFQYLASPVLLSFEPSLAIRGGDKTSLLTIRGREFRNSSGLRCVIGDDLSLATFVSDSMVRCEMRQPTRASAAVGLVDLSVAMSPEFAPGMLKVSELEGIMWSPPSSEKRRSQSTVETRTSTLRFDFVERASVNAIFPSSGPLSDTTLVRLSGSNFVVSPESACFFGRQRVPAIVHNSTEVTCIVFANMWSIAGATTVGFSSREQDRARGDLVFFFYYSPSIISLRPLYGSANGGTQLAITFDQSGPEYLMERIICAIGDNIVEGTLVAPGKIVCESPAAIASSRSVQTRISFNGQHFIDGSPFWYIDEPQFESLAPSSCHEKCNQRIRVRGSKFSRVIEMWCRFGTLNPSRAQWLSAQEVVCRAPSHFPGTVELTFSMNGVDFKDTGLTFAYSAHEASFQYSPAAGPNTGGTMLTIGNYGAKTSSCQSLVCLFGVTPILPSAISNSSVQCISPPFEDSEDVTVSLTCDDEIVVELEPAFHYYAPPVISEVLPRAIMLDTTTHLVLRGSQFDFTAVMQCRFDGKYVMEALYIDSSEIRCPVPRVEWPVFSFIAVDLTLNNGADFSPVRSRVPVIAPLQVFGLTPKHAVIGHRVEVIVQVSDLLHSDELLCRIGESYATSGRVVTRTSMACTIPIISTSGKVRLAVSTNGIDFTESGELALTYHVLPSVGSLQRSVGSMHGGEIVIVEGQSFFDGGRFFCQFGEDEDDKRKELFLPTTYLSSTEISCAVPAWTQSRNEIDKPFSTSTVTVRVGFLNGQDIVYLQSRADPLEWVYFPDFKTLLVMPAVIFANELTTLTMHGLKQQLFQHAIECVIRDQHGLALSNSHSLVVASGGGAELTMLVNISTPGSYHLDLWSGGYLLNSGTRLVLQVKPKLGIVGVTPRAGPLRGGTVVHVSIQGLSPLVEPMLCVFNDQSTPAVAVNDSSLWCRSPRSDTPGTISLSVALSSGPQAEAPRGFTYFPDDVISEIRPTQISSFSRASVIVIGTNFYNGSLSPTCRVGSVVTPASVRSSIKILCEPVYLGEGTYSISVACDGSNYAASNATIVVVTARTQAIAVVAPKRNPSFGGRPASVIGRLIEIGSAPDARATVAPSTRLEYETPSIPPGNDTVGVTWNAQEYSFTPQELLVNQAISVTAITPAHGPRDRATDNIAVYGWGDFSNTTFVSVAPPHQPDFITLEVSLTDVDVSTNQQVLHQFDSVAVLEVSPSILPASGGATVSVKAGRIDQDSTYECLFIRECQTLTRPAYALNDTDLACYSPQWGPGEAHVGILIDGRTQLLSEQRVTFVNEPRIRSISPLNGPVTGGTVVKIHGDDLSDSSIQCVFGDTLAAAPSSITDTQVECRAPSGLTIGVNISEGLMTKVNVRLQIQESVVSNAMSFAYDPEIAIHSVSRDHVSEQSGTVVWLVEGSAFMNTPELACKAGGSSSVPGLFLDSAHVLCHVPAAALWHSSRSIGISLNNQDFMNFDLPASEMIPDMVLSSIVPRSGPVEGNTEVVIQLSGGGLLLFAGLQQSVTIFCSFGDNKAPAVLDETLSTVKCWSPAVQTPSSVPVGVAWRIGDIQEEFSAAQPLNPLLHFKYELALQLLSLSPTNGNSFDPTALVISGSGFRDGASVRFAVGGNASYAEADVRSATELVVAVPLNEIEARGGGPVSLSITTNSVDFSNSLVFVYEPRAVVLSVTPRHLFRDRFAGADQVKVLISGANFDELATTTLQCHIGSAAPTYATWLSMSQLLCYPPDMPAGVYSVAISTNGRDFTKDHVEIVYHDNFILTDVSPPFGSIWGKTQVTVSGARFDAINDTTDVVCVFGTTESEFVIVNASMATCESPPYTDGGDERGVVNFAIGFRGGSDIEDSLSDRVRNISSIWSFVYAAMPTITSVDPQFIVGNELQVLRVSGSGFKDTALLVCSFGNVQTQAAYLKSTLVECDMSKSALLSGAYSVEVSNNGQDFTNSEVEIVVINPLMVLSIEPARGLINRPIPVKIRGTNFAPLLLLQCLVGESHVVNATYLSDSWIECVLPASSSPLKVTLAISANNLQFVTVPTPFSYDDVVVVYSIYPPSGPVRGGTVVVVTGEGFMSGDGEALYCRFGSLYVPAQVVSATQVKCLSPSHRSTSLEVVAVAVTKQNSHHRPAAPEDKQIFETGVVFAYRLLPSVISIDPPMGTTAGGTVVQIKAREVDVQSSIWCRFGDILVKSDVSIAGAEGDTMVCTSPPAKQGRVFLEISTNQVDFSESYVPFYFETRASITEIRPRYGKLSGGTRAIIKGRDFNDTGTLECAFGSSRVPAKWLSSQSLECATPTGFATMEVQRVAVTSRTAQNEVQRVTIGSSTFPGGTFRLSLAGVLTIDISVLATATDIALAVTAILPRGSVLVRSFLGLAFTWTIEFVSFEDSLSLLGYDASKLTGVNAAITVTRDQVGVPAPTGYLSLAFGNASTLRIPFSSSGPEILQLLTAIQPLAAFQSVHVTSQAMAASWKLYTQLNWDITFQLPALNLSNRGILCNLPLFQAEVTHTLGDEVTAVVTRTSSPCVAVSVFLNGQDTAQGQLQFAYMGVPRVLSITPALGSASGGTSVTLSGKNFVSGPDLMCVFGDFKSPATFVSPSEIHCSSPPHEASTVFVKLLAGSVERPHHDLLSETIALFQYHDEIVFESFVPTHGPNTGGTQLKISGSGLLNTATLACRLLITLPQRKDPAQVILQAAFSSHELITCQMPSLAAYFDASSPRWTSSASATTSVEISLNGVDFVLVGSVYSFIPVIETTEIKPVIGPMDGGTLVIVQMEPPTRDISHCKFGDGSPVVATTVSSRAVSCTTTRLVPGGQGTSIQVSLSSNGVDFSASTQTFTYTAPLEVASVTPTVGPTAGGAKVTLTITLASVYDTIYCRFGEQIVQGTIASATIIVCSTPPSEAQRVRLNLSFNGIDFDIQAGDFEYVNDLSSRFQLTPLNGFTTGGTLVTISGTTFSTERRYSCKFDAMVVVAEAANATHVCCRTPPVATPRRVAVRISDNALDFTIFNLSFVYDAPLYVTSISPFGGDLEGRQLVTVTGGDFNAGAQDLLCRFGDQVVDATVRSSTSATCVSPPLTQIREVQQLRIASATLVPVVQRVSISAVPLVPTVQEVKLIADPLVAEIQEFRVYGNSVSEVQRITVSSQAYADETVSIRTDIKPLVQEIQAVQMHSSSYIGGSFRLILGDQETAMLSSYAAPSELESALEALSNAGQVTVAKTTKDAEGSCFWVITFLDRAGDVPMLRVHNVSLMDSGSQDLVIQVSELVKGQGAMLIGSFQLAIDERLSAAIAYDASEAQIAQALSNTVGTTGVVKVTRTGPFLNKVYEWLVTFDGLPDRVRYIKTVTTELSGGAGLVIITAMAPGAKSEQQRISTTLPSGGFVCSVLGKPSQSIAFDATAAAVTAAFDPVVFGRITSVGVQGGPWTITFLDWAGNIPLLSCGAQQTVIEIAPGTGLALGGSFSISFGSETTSALAVSASASDLKSALKALSAVTDVTVSASTTDFNGGTTWLITFPASDGDTSLLVGDSSSLIGTVARIVVAEVQRGNTVDGVLYFALGMSSSRRFAPRASTAELQLALSDVLPAPSVLAQVSTATSLPGHGVIITITFSKSAADVEQLTLKSELLTGAGPQIESKTLQSGSQTIGGSFVLEYDGVRTPSLPWNVSADDLQYALQFMKSIPGDGIQVTRSGPVDLGGGMNWRITFLLNLMHPGNLIKAIYDSTTLTGSNVNMQVTLLVLETPRLSGTIQLSLAGPTSALIDISKSEKAIELVLEALPGIGDLQVTKQSPVGTTNQVLLDISFLSMRHAVTAPPLFTVATQTLTGNSPSASVQQLSPGAHNEIQRLSIYSAVVQPEITFHVTWNGQTAAASASSTLTALKMQTIIASIPGAGNVVVERITSSIGVGFSWFILFRDLSISKSLSVLTIQVTSASPTGLVVDILRSQSNLSPPPGNFALGIGEICTELSLGNYCTSAQTSQLPVTVDRVTFEHELSLLPNLDGITVSQQVSVPDWEYEWRITFPFGFGDVPLLSLYGSSLLGSGVSASIEQLQKGTGLTGAQVALEVSSNGQDFSNSGVIFRYALTPDVLLLIPSHGPQRGETEVVVVGINFANTSSLSCRFRGDAADTIVQAARFMNSTHLTCISPAVHQEGDVFLEVSNYGALRDASFTTSHNIFSFDKDLAIKTVTPSLGPITGNFSVALTGGPFRKTDATRCRFADVVTLATWMSFDEIICMAPPHTQGLFALHVTQNDQDYLDTGFPFFYYLEQGIHRIFPVFGPASIAGTIVTVEGSGFVNSTLLACRFGFVVFPGEYVSPKVMKCMSPPMSSFSGGMQSVPLSEHRNTLTDPSLGSVYLFPEAHYYPQYWSRLVSLEVSNNRQDFSLSGVNFLYYQDATLSAIYPTSAYNIHEISVFAKGANFINSTSLACRMGLQVFRATFVTSQLLLCTVKQAMFYQDSRRDTRIKVGRHALFEISNNGRDFTSAHVVFEFLGSCPSGFYCPQALAGKSAKCPRGSFCSGQGNRNFTLCPRGTYQPQMIQAACLRCPVGYHCPHPGMHVPRLCPAGFICDVTGIEDAEQPCPEGHFCLEGTATTSTTCSPLARTGRLVASTTESESPVTLRRRSNREFLQAAVGTRRSGCWNNATSDFGLQVSKHPSRFWMELRKLPLAPGALFAPIRGRFCLDDSCLRLADADNFQTQDENFDYTSTSFALRRPVPCPKGTYCHPGTAGNDLSMKNFSMPQPCFESMYCPEGSLSPLGYGECAIGFYCPFGTRIPCPAGTYCPQIGHSAPISCPPGQFNAMVAQANCTTCAVGFICPGFNRLLPVLCPAGYVCSKRGLSSPNSLCPKGFYCLEGTATSDCFRNDTRLRPYPCKPGTYCLKGVVADEVRVGDYRYAQNCTEGFYCEVGSSSPKGSGLCPLGFVCPSGTAAPIPTDVGKFADLEGTVSAADCAPGYYSPTIESTTCIPCPPGTSCENDGTAVATVCEPGSYRGSLNADGISCLACPQGTWSKNWEIRGVEECIRCAPGMVCPIDGITYPCTSDDLPHVFVPLLENFSIAECLDKGDAYFFGVLLEPWIDELGRGPHFLPSRDGKCYENFQPRGSVLYQRLADFHGAMYELESGVPHQGYGDVDQYPAPNIFGRGSLVIDLQLSQMYDVTRNCTQGFFHKGQWFPGTCEADIFCSATSASSAEFVSQAQPCPEGYVCDLETSAEKAFSHYCPGGYVCGPGTTPDLNIESPRGQLNGLCPATKFCAEGTAESQKEQSMCPAGYFCPTGTTNPYLGYIADDAMRRRLARDEADPFLGLSFTKYIADGDIRIVSAHDMRCFNGIDDDLEAIFHQVTRPSDQRLVVVNRAVKHDLKCARDHKWRHVELAIRRNDCDCVSQIRVVQHVFQLWQCTATPSTADPTIFDPNIYGWKAVHLAKRVCRFNSTESVGGGGIIDLSQQINASGVTFQLTWTHSTSVRSYDALKALVVTQYQAQVDQVPSTLTTVDPFLYDLKHAIDVVERFGDETLTMVGFVGSSSTANQPLRLDTCACQKLFKCPNGTTSAIGSDDIYHCVKTGSEILQRLTPIPPSHPRLVSGSDFKALSGVGKGIGSLVLQPLEVATITINTTQLSTNITYKDHYQLSVYTNCKPCPPRYKCDLKSVPPLCTYPDNNNNTATQLLTACMTEKNDLGVCQKMPFYCEKRSLVTTDATGASVPTVLPGCCSCERREMPQYFEDTTQDLGFPDNKHGYLQFSIAAVERTELTITLELLHGLYVQDFVDGFTDDRFDLSVFTPSRADYAPETPSMNAFFAVIDQMTYTDLMLPLNLPESRRRIVGTLTYEYAVEERVFIDRESDIMVGDPSLPAKHGFIRNKLQNTLGLLVSDKDSNDNVTATDSKPVIAPSEYFGLYPITDPRENVVYSDTWWAQKLDSSEFIALSYFPFFSSCRGFDSHMWIAKLLETHPDCDYVSYDETVEVNQYPWKKKTVPNADKCVIDYTVETTTSSSAVAVVQSLQRGISLSCTYEENLEGGAEKPRWYEAATGTTLFYMTKDPASPDDFVGQAASVNPLWGRSDTFQSYLGTDNLIAVKGKPNIE